MQETILNLFLFVEKDAIKEIGATVYNLEGTDREKKNFLESNVNSDFNKSRRFSIPEKYLDTNIPSLSHQKYRSMMRQGTHLNLFEEIFQYYNAPSNPLVVITPIINGKPHFQLTTNNSALQGENIPEELKPKGIEIEDYLTKYMTSEGFDLPRLLNDDYLLSIKSLFNQGFYVSCCKLLLSFIDTMAFLAYGDKNDENVFKKWLNKYADMESLGITSSELWELRNSLLHMTNLDSRKVLKGNVKRLAFFVGTLPEEIPRETDNLKYFNLRDLIVEMRRALESWINYLNYEPSEMTNFIQRYDLVVSDVRKSFHRKEV